MSELVDMARAAMHDERLSDGALYGKLAERIESLEAQLAERKAVPVGLQAVQKALDTAFIEASRPGQWIESVRSPIADAKDALTAYLSEAQEGEGEGQDFEWTEWVDWRGGPHPPLDLAPYDRPEIRYRSSGITQQPTSNIRWSHLGYWDDVLAYRVMRPVATAPAEKAAGATPAPPATG